MAEIAATGRHDVELPAIAELVRQVQNNPQYAREALDMLRKIRSGRQDDADG